MNVQGDDLHRLDIRMLRFWNRPHREEPAMLAQALLSSGRVDEALGVTEAALLQDPDDADLLLVRGRAWFLRGDLEKAQRLLVRAAKREPGWAEPWHRLGEVLVARRRWEHAIEVLDRARSLGARDAGLDLLRREATRIHGLETRLARFLDDPGSEDAALLAQELLSHDRIDEALDVIEAALADDPDDVDAHVLHARVLLARGRPESAREALERALRADPEWDEPRHLYEETFGEPPPTFEDEQGAELDAFLASLADQPVAVMPPVNDTLPGAPAPVPPNAWGLHLAHSKPKRPYRPPSPTELFPRRTCDAPR